MHGETLTFSHYLNKILEAFSKVTTSAHQQHVIQLYKIKLYKRCFSLFSTYKFHIFIQVKPVTKELKPACHDRLCEFRLNKNIVNCQGMSCSV